MALSSRPVILQSSQSLITNHVFYIGVVYSFNVTLRVQLHISVCKETETQYGMIISVYSRSTCILKI